MGPNTEVVLYTLAGALAALTVGFLIVLAYRLIHEFFSSFGRAWTNFFRFR